MSNIHFFRLHNSIWALQTAKANVDRYFPVVGVLEELNTTLEVLEEKLPYFFKGVQTLYYKDLLRKLTLKCRDSEFGYACFQSLIGIKTKEN